MLKLKSQSTLLTLLSLLRRSCSLFVVLRMDRKLSSALIRKNCLDIGLVAKYRIMCSCDWLTEDNYGEGVQFDANRICIAGIQQFERCQQSCELCFDLPIF